MRLGLICQQQQGFPPSLSSSNLQQELQNNQQFSSNEQAGNSQFLSWNTQNGAQASGSSAPDIKPSILQSNNLSSLMDMKSNGSKDNHEEVEVMSTDSSSSSSSDSQ